ncbi:unnamed protein product, partial [Mesorhabditis belari]|uniref:Uncharacterized protein n=1 Tax=Mesorhabditis belari TaxID=2138241 RepID=A0AAF3FU84_9BILA
MLSSALLLAATFAQQQSTSRNQPKNTKNQNFIPCYPPQPIYPNQLMDPTQDNIQYPQQFNNNQNLPSGSTGPNGKRIPQQPQKGQKPIIPQINQFPGQSMNQLKQQPLPPQNILKNEIPVDICTSFTHCNTGMKCCAMQKSNLLGLSYQRFNLPVLGRCTKACQIGEINL